MSTYPKRITVQLSTEGIKELKKGLSAYRKWINERTAILCKRLAEMGAVRASMNFSHVIYTGDEDHQIKVKHKGKNCYSVEAWGKTVLFVEFGTGIRYSQPGHPEPHEYGAGTYPGAGHWNDPNGWWFPKKKRGKKTADQSIHTYGNPPNMPMYNTVKDLEKELERVVREVFH